MNGQIRNTNFEIRNEHQCLNWEMFKIECLFNVFCVRAWNSFRASCFGFRISFFCLLGATASAEGFPRVPPTPPDKAEATFEVQHGFRMELIAAEPLVASPVDLAYDEDGRAYVVEMRDYPFPEEKNAEPTVFEGTVRLIEDTDGDGKFDKATVFADQLAWPTSACCYKGGVFVAAAPDIWYFKDTDGDRKADVRRKVFTGFSRYNVQAIMNSLRWGLDNKIYGAAAGNGGSIRHADRPDDPLLPLSRRDFRFDPVTEKIEPISGGERYGATFDDWGNRFLCNIRNPVQHVVLPLHYMQRNPHLVVPRMIHDAAEAGDQLRVYRISPPEAWREFRAQRWALEQQAMPRSELIGAGYWTSSSGVSVYRGGAYPEQFRGNVFIGEVAGNLIHRQVITRDGVTFKSRRADENTEFVRSRDNWFRPVNFVNAPDGTLTVLDMYRETIEHPWSIPDDIKAQLDLSSGKERGRLYRLRPPEFNRVAPKKFSDSSDEQLAASLSSPNSWERETAHRLLIERQAKSVIPLLRQFIYRFDAPRHVLHALHVLKGFGALEDDDLVHVLNQRELSHVVGESHTGLRCQAIMLAEGRLQERPDLTSAIIRLASDEDVAVRFEVALSIGQARPSITESTLLAIAGRDAGDPWMRAAILSSAGQVAGDLAVKMLLRRQVTVMATTPDGKAVPKPLAVPIQGAELPAGFAHLLRELSATVGAADQQGEVDMLLSTIATATDRELAFASLSGLGQGLARRREKLSERIDRLPAATRESLDRQIAQAAAQATATSATPSERTAAIQLLSYLAWADVHAPLITCLAPAQPREIQQASLRTLGTFNEPAVATELLARWKQLTPPLRDEAVTVLLSRPIWNEPLVAALEKGVVPVAQVSIPQRSRLASLRDPKLAERAKQVLASVALGPRKETIDKYQASLALKGDTAGGQLVYRRECANCHKLRGEGHDVGPSLETIQHRSPQEILVHVLDPNREVSPNFLDYTVRLADGRVLTGMISTETDSGLTLRRAQNQEDTILRAEIEEIAASGKSLMPDGMEQKITPQEMADLIAYLRRSN